MRSVGANQLPWPNPPLEGEFLRQLRERVAGLAIGPSTLRNMVGAGGVRCARHFCSDESILKRITVPGKFSVELDAITKELSLKLPKRKKPGGRAWGPARKILNIFLSDATYNAYLRERYGLARIESALEVPLDSYVATGIASDAAELHLGYKFDPWRGVIHVTPSMNDRYQSAATEIAEHYGYGCRGHLDLRYFRQRQKWGAKSSRIGH